MSSINDNLKTIVKMLEDAGFRAWKSLAPPLFESVRRESTSVCVMPGSFTSDARYESSAGRLGDFRFKVRYFHDSKVAIEGEKAIEFFYGETLDKLLDALCGKDGDGQFQGPIFLTGISEPGGITDKSEFFRFVDFNFIMRTGI